MIQPINFSGSPRPLSQRTRIRTLVAGAGLLAAIGGAAVYSIMPRSLEESRQSLVFEFKNTVAQFWGLERIDRLEFSLGQTVLELARRISHQDEWPGAQSREEKRALALAELLQKKQEALQQLGVDGSNFEGLSPSARKAINDYSQFASSTVLTELRQLALARPETREMYDVYYQHILDSSDEINYFRASYGRIEMQRIP